MKRNLIASKKALQFGISGAIGGFLGNLITEPFLHTGRQISRSFLETVASTSIWFALVGAGISTAILVGYYYYIKGRVQLQPALKKGGFFGLIAGGVAGALAEAIYTGLGPTEWLRVICWGIAGSLLGLALSKRIPNLGLQRGAGGGAVGGVLGGILFIVFAYTLSGIFGRSMGCGVIGFCIGIMLIVAETLLSKAWLIVHYDNGDTRTLNLGTEPITFGSDDEFSIICIPHVAPVAVKFQLEAGQIVCEDLVKNIKDHLEPGEQRRVGNCIVTVDAVGKVAEVPAKISPALSPTFSQPLSTDFPAFSLKVEGQIIPLRPGTQLFNSHISSLTSTAANGVVAEVSSAPKEPKKLSLRNLSEQTWWATENTGNIKLVEPGSTLTLEYGTHIEFGSVTGEFI